MACFWIVSKTQKTTYNISILSCSPSYQTEHLPKCFEDLSLHIQRSSSDVLELRITRLMIRRWRFTPGLSAWACFHLTDESRSFIVWSLIYLRTSLHRFWARKMYWPSSLQES